MSPDQDAHGYARATAAPVPVQVYGDRAIQRIAEFADRRDAGLEDQVTFGEQPHLPRRHVLLPSFW